MITVAYQYTRTFISSNKIPLGSTSHYNLIQNSQINPSKKDLSRASRHSARHNLNSIKMSDIRVAHDDRTARNGVELRENSRSQISRKWIVASQSEPLRSISDRENDSWSKCRCNRRSANVAPPAGAPFFLSFFRFFPLFLSFSPAGRRVGNVFQASLVYPTTFPFFTRSFFLSRSLPFFFFNFFFFFTLLTSYVNSLSSSSSREFLSPDLRARFINYTCSTA